MSGGERILVTGASGFLGRALVAAARDAGLPVVALVRAEGAEALWAGDSGVAAYRLDLAGPGAAVALAPLLDGVSAVIHAAARMRGTEAEHARDTVAATEALVAALTALATEGPRPRLLLASSFSVYGYAALPDWATLDERTPVEPDPTWRDPYSRAKLAQEAVTLRAAQGAGLSVALMRIGVLYGPGHMWAAQLGFRFGGRFGGRVVCPGGDVPVPAIHVEDCAAALVSAARRAAASLPPSDLPMPEGAGHVEIVNLVAPAAPSQGDWLRAIGEARVIRLPRGPLLRLARLGDLAASLLPPLGRALPGVLHEGIFAARFKPLHYSAARAEARLGFAPRTFAEAAAASLRETGTSRP